MKISKKFSYYTIAISALLAVTGVIAAIFGTRMPSGYTGEYPKSFSEEALLRISQIISDPELLAHNIFYILTIVGFGFALLFILQLRRQLMRPLLAAVKFSLALADNKFPKKLYVPQENNEVSELISSLNFMRDRLQSTFLKLQKSHENEKNARFSAELLTQMKSGFIQHIIPDILENIDVISSSMFILQKSAENGQNAERDTLISGIRRALSLLAKHFNRLDDLCRVGIDKNQIELKKLKSADFLAFIVKLNNSLFESRNIKIEEEYNSTMPASITADSEILRMLLTMAIFAIGDNSEPGESIHCACFAENENIIFSVRDTKLCPQRDPLFELYNDFVNSGEDISQADKRLITLLMLKEWIHTLDGNLLIINNNPICNMELQLVFNEWEMTESVPNTPTASRRLSSVSTDIDDDNDFFDPIPSRILLAESNRDLIIPSRILLAEDQHQLSAVPDVANLLTAAKNNKFDIIIISLQISETTLRTIIETIHANKAINRNTPLMVISSDKTLKKDNFTDEEVKYFLNRPVDFQMVRHIVGRCRDVGQQ